MEMRLRKSIIVWISDTVSIVLLFFQFELRIAEHAAHIEKKFCEVNNFFFKKELISFFQEEWASLLSAVKPFSSDLEG